MSTVKIDMNKHGVARVTLNRPDVHNAFNEDLIRELHDAFARLARHREVRVIMLTGAGKSFSAGADLNWMQRAAAQSESENRADALAMARMFAEINGCPKPVVALVNGTAMGGGVGLAACCDIVIAHPSAMFGLTEVRLGLIPAVISPYVLARIGDSAARRFMLTAERFDAAMAQRLGLVHEIGADIEAVAAPVIDNLLLNGPGAMAHAKAFIEEVRAIEDPSRLPALTSAKIASVRASEEGREGISAFLEKRKPDWSI